MPIGAVGPKYGFKFQYASFFPISEITILQSINTILKERHEIENNFKNLSIKYTKLQKEETERRDKVS
jgi:hypothetical protein